MACLALVGLTASWLLRGDETVADPGGGGAPSPAPPSEPSVRTAEPAPAAAEKPTETEKPGSLSGVVVDESGAPVKGATVVAVGGLDAVFPGLECASKSFMSPLPGVDFLSCGCSTNAEALVKLLPPPLAPAVLGTAETDANGVWHLEGLPRSKVWTIHARSGAREGSTAAYEARLVVSAKKLLEGRVVDDDGRRVAGARVWIIDDTVTELVTDAHGRFSSKETDGPKRVIAFKEGLLPDLKLASIRSDWVLSRQAFFGAMGGPIASDVAVELRLAAPIELKGRVLYQGRGLAGAEVTQSMAPCGAKAVSGADGSFVMRGMREQRYQLEAKNGSLSAKLSASSSRQPLVLELEELVLVEGTVTRDDGVPVRATVRAKQVGASDPQATGSTKDDGTYSLGALPDGEWTFTAESMEAKAQEQRVRLRRPTARVDFVLERGVSVKGRAVGAHGAPIPGTWVRVYPGVVRDTMSAPLTYRPAVTPQLDGSFEVDGLAEGDVTVWVTAQGYEDALVPVTAPREGVEVVLKRGSRISGAVRTRSGALEEKASVSAVAIDETGASTNHTYGALNTRGRYELTRLPPGRYELTARTASRTAKATVEVRAEREVNVDLELADGARVSGVVVDEAGRPIAGAAMSTSPQPAKYARQVSVSRRFPGLPPPVTSGDDGRFLLDDLSSDGTVTVVAQHAGYETGAVDGVRAGDSVVRVVLKETGLVTGRVVGEHGALNRFTVSGEPQEDPDGRFRVHRGTGSTLELNLAAEGYAASRRTVSLPPQGSVDVGDVRLSRGASVSGRVLDADRKPVANVSVTAERTKGEQLGSATSDSGGRFFLEALPDEDVVVSVRSHGFLPKKQPVPRGQQQVELVLDRGLKLSGRLVDQDGKPIANEQLLLSAKGGPGGMVTSDAQGRFELAGLAPGEIELRPWELGSAAVHVPKTKVVIERDGQTIELRGHVGGATLRVKFRGYPRSLKLEVQGESAAREGRFAGAFISFTAVPPGSHRLLYEVGRAEPVTRAVVMGRDDVTVTIDER